MLMYLIKWVPWRLTTFFFDFRTRQLTNYEHDTYDCVKMNYYFIITICVSNFKCFSLQRISLVNKSTLQLLLFSNGLPMASGFFVAHSDGTCAFIKKHFSFLLNGLQSSSARFQGNFLRLLMWIRTPMTQLSFDNC